MLIIGLLTHKKVSLQNFKPIFWTILRFFNIEYHGQTSFEVVFVMFSLVSIKLRKLKSVYQENQKTWTLWFCWVIPYTMGLKLFLKYFSNFLIVVNRLRFGKSLFVLKKTERRRVTIIKVGLSPFLFASMIALQKW